MVTCKDCLHVEVCKDYAINYLKTNNNTPMEALEKEVGDYPCCRFQNRSLFVKLPCKVGDTVYIYNPDLIYDPSSVVKAKVLSIQLNSNNEIMILLYDEECDRFSIDKNVFIKSVKFTRKEAEQALKETNNKK